MAVVTIPYRFVVKRDTAANFVAANTILLDGEFGLETDTGQIKMGPGAWNSITDYQIPGLFDLTGRADGDALVWDASAEKYVHASVMVNPMTAEGDLIVGGTAGAVDVLPVGADGTFLGVVAGVPTYVSATAPNADDVPITDAGGYFTGTDVEAALQELGAASGGGGGAGTARRNYFTVGAQAAASQVGVAITTNATTLNNNTPASTNIFTSLARIAYRLAASSSACPTFYNTHAPSIWMGNSAGYGGYDLKILWGAGEGVTNTSCRCFVGLSVLTGANTDVDPSTLLNMIGMGWDSSDTNIQMMHNDGSGTATKIDLGASLPVPTVDSTEVYSIVLACDPNGSSVDYTVTRLSNQASATGTISTDMPSSTTFLNPRGYISVGGVSTQTSIALMYLGWEPGQ